MSKPLSELGHAIAEILATAEGRVNAVTAADIANRLDMSSRRVREIISTEFKALSRCLPAPLISIPPTGYWLSTEADDLRERQQWLTTNRDRYDIALREHRAMCRDHGLEGVLHEAPKPTTNQRKP